MVTGLSYQTNVTPPGVNALALEVRTARLTILVDPRKKELFERLCAEEDATPSQVIRRLMRRYIEERTGKPWSPEARSKSASTRSRKRPARKRR